MRMRIWFIYYNIFSFGRGVILWGTGVCKWTAKSLFSTIGLDILYFLFPRRIGWRSLTKKTFCIKLFVCGRLIWRDLYNSEIVSNLKLNFVAAVTLRWIVYKNCYVLIQDLLIWICYEVDVGCTEQPATKSLFRV